MKITASLSIIFVFFAHISLSFASSDTAPEYQLDSEPLICTMQYAPVCGIDGETYGNSCMAQNTTIAYAGECSSMVDRDLLSELNNDAAQVMRIKTLLQTVQTQRLESAITAADQLIQNTKLLRIAQQMQIERITLLTFLKNLINAELASR